MQTFRPGIVKYIGPVHFFPLNQVCYGVALNNAKGNHDGKLQNQRYFKCKNNHGIICKVDQIEEVIPNIHYLKQLLLDKYVKVLHKGNGFVRFVGVTEFAGNTVVIGVELDDDIGTCNGSKNGKVYFETDDKRGIFTIYQNVSILKAKMQDAQQLDTSTAPNAQEPNSEFQQHFHNDADIHAKLKSGSKPDDEINDKLKSNKTSSSIKVHSIEEHRKTLNQSATVEINYPKKSRIAKLNPKKQEWPSQKREENIQSTAKDSPSTRNKIVIPKIFQSFTQKCLISSTEVLCVTHLDSFSLVTKSISQIKPLERVLSYDFSRNKFACGTVNDCIVSVSSSLIHISISVDGHATSNQEITCTPYHRFYVTNQHS